MCEVKKELTSMCWSIGERHFSGSGAAGRTRTDTLIRREILSLLCLPISPPRRHFVKLIIMTRSESFKQESDLLTIEKPDPYGHQGNKMIDPVVLRSSISL